MDLELDQQRENDLISQLMLPAEHQTLSCDPFQPDFQFDSIVHDLSSMYDFPLENDGTVPHSMSSLNIQQRPLVSNGNEHSQQSSSNLSPGPAPPTLISSSPSEVLCQDDFERSLQQIQQNEESPHDLTNATKPNVRRKSRFRHRPLDSNSSVGSISANEPIPPVSARAAKGLRLLPPKSYSRFHSSDEEEEEGDDDDDDSRHTCGSTGSTRKHAASEYKPHIKHFKQLTADDIANIDFKQLTTLMKEAKLTAEQVSLFHRLDGKHLSPSSFVFFVLRTVIIRSCAADPRCEINKKEAEESPQCSNVLQ